jgi:uncharacterized membrane protein
VKLSATPPSNWTVEWDTETIPTIAVNDQATVTAFITPAGGAVAGDYVITMRASTEDADGSIQVRTTVETSSIWGFVGLALIAIILVGLFLVFRRYGRR